MCINAVEVGPWQLYYVPDHFKTQEIVRQGSDGSLIFFAVCSQLVTQQVKIWHDEGEYHDDDEIIKWYEDYQKRKTQKVKIEEGLICIA